KGSPCDAGGCVPIEVATVDGPLKVASDPQAIYWTARTNGVAFDGGTVQSASKTTPGVVSLVTGEYSPIDLAVDGTWVYYSAQTAGGTYAIRRVLNGGGQSDLIAAPTAGAPLDVVVDPNYVYWSSQYN